MRKHILIFVVAATLCASQLAAQTHKVNARMLLPREAEIALAMSAAPDTIAQHAAVYVYTTSGYEKVRDGANGFTCLVNRDAELDGYHALKPTCWDAHGSSTIVPAVLEAGRQQAAGVAARDIVATLRQQIAAGKIQKFSKSGVAYMLAGDIAEYDVATGKMVKEFPPHMMTYAIGASEKDLGITERHAMTDIRAPMFYQSALGYAYIVVRVPVKE